MTTGSGVTTLPVGKGTLVSQDSDWREENRPPAGSEVVKVKKVAFLIVGKDETNYSVELYDTDRSEIHVAAEEFLKQGWGEAPVEYWPIAWDVIPQADIDNLRRVFLKYGKPWPPASSGG